MAYFNGSGNASGPDGSVGGSANSSDLTTPTQPSAPPTISAPMNGPQSTGTPTLLPIESDFLDAAMTTAFAKNHAATADGYITKLGELAASLQAPIINPVFPQNVNAPAISAPIAPKILPVNYNPPAVPSPFLGTLTLSQQFPLFTSQPPQLLFPNAPAVFSQPTPTSPAINTNFTYPTVSVALPPVPQLLSIDVKPFTGVTFPTLSAISPVLTAAQPRVVNYIPNAPYADALLSELSTTLYARIATGNTGINTGLPAAIEANIWNREREREFKTQRDSMAALDRMEAMGYAFPPGTFIDAQIKIQTESNAVFAGSSRDIATAQAKLEQDNIKQAIDAATALESKLIDYANFTEQRRFEATKYATEAGISIYNAQVQAYSAAVTAYRAAIDVYTAQIAGARAQVEIYTAQIAAEKLKVDIDTALVEQYKVQVEAAVASIEVFKGEISIIQTQAQIEQLKVSIFGEQVRAYSAQANVYTAQVEGYKASIEAEGAKEQAYATATQAYGTLVTATTAQINAQVEIFKAQLAAKTEEYDAYKSQVEGQAEQVRAIASANQSTAAIYSATVQGVSSYNEAMIKEWQAQIQLAETVAQIGVSAAQAQGQLYLTTQSIVTDAAKVGAQVEAQIAASALGAVTWATHRARQDSVSISQQTSFGNNKSSAIQISTGNNTNTSTSSSNSTATQMSTSVSSAISTQKTIQSVA